MANGQSVPGFCLRHIVYGAHIKVDVCDVQSKIERLWSIVFTPRITYLYFNRAEKIRFIYVEEFNVAGNVNGTDIS